MRKITLLICCILFASISIFAQSETEKGIEFYRKGSFNKSISVLRKAIKKDSENREAWTYLGACFFKKGNEKEALKYFIKADSIYTFVASEELKIISQPRPSYTDDARNNFIVGKIRLAVEFGKDGKINFVFPILTLPNGLTENTINA